MCGVTGLVKLSLVDETSFQLVRSMNRAIEHRGPDGEGFYSNANVVLGHRRLSIIDLDRGDQPIYNEDGSVVVIHYEKATSPHIT